MSTSITISFRQNLKALGFDFKRPKLCTVRLSRKIIPGLNSYSLGNICADEGIPISARHRARGDVEATVELFRRLIQRDDQFIHQFFFKPKIETGHPSSSFRQISSRSSSEKHWVYYFKNLPKRDYLYWKSKQYKAASDQSFL